MEVFDFFEKNQSEEINVQEKCTFPFFGEININNLEEYYSVNFEFKNETITVDLNFENKKIEKFRIEQIISFLENVNDFDNSNRVCIEKDFIEEGITSDFINSYIKEFEQDDLPIKMGLCGQNASTDFELLKQLKLVRIGIYPDGKYGVDFFTTFDYSIDVDGDPCNQLLVVNTGKKGKLRKISWVS